MQTNRTTRAHRTATLLPDRLLVMVAAMKGSIKKYIAKDGKVTWRATVDIPPDPETGKRRQKRITAPTKKEAEAQVTQLLASIQNGGFGEADASKIPVSDYLKNRWLPSIEHSVRPATLMAYRNALKHATPKIGRLMLSKLGPMHLQRLYSELLGNNLSPATVTLIHRVLHRALGQAVRWRLLAHNPSEAVEVPRAEQLEYTTWTPEEAAKFLATTARDKLAALWRLALLTGMRRGELLALHWDNIDFERATISITHSMTRGKEGGFVEGAPKTAAGRRQIALPASAVEALRAHRTKQKEAKLAAGSAYNDRGIVFADKLGDPISASKVGYQFDRLINIASLPHIRFHDLRHTCATLMLRGGEHPKIVQERLGHANISMTLNRYSHVTPDMQKDAAQRLDKMLENAS